MPLPVIDLFAGPGGLGEGFSSIARSDGTRAFKIQLSIEKDEHAHRTLELRAFFREFPMGEVPDDYYKYLQGRIARVDLFERHPRAARRAMREAWLAELGGRATSNQVVNNRIRTALGNQQRWVLIGGPPCQAYSLVGRSRIIGAGNNGKTSGGAARTEEALRVQEARRQAYDDDPRHLLYEHYLRIIALYRPPIFVMENVKGLLSATVKKKPIFDKILRDLREPLKAVSGTPASIRQKALQYRLVPLAADRGDLLGEFSSDDFLLRAEEYGLPQARHRVIILGIRSDLRVEPNLLEATTKRVTAEDVIGDLPRLRSGLSKEEDTAQAWRDAVRDVLEARWLTDANVPEKVRLRIASSVCHVHSDLTRGAAFQSVVATPRQHSDWYCDPRLNGVCNHESRGHIRSDLHRYFFAAVFARIMGRSPLLEDLPKALLPAHKNVEDALEETKFNDRFRVQLADRPSTTVVSHIAKDGHYYIHYDPSQCRSLTVREAARLQTFPDNYFFEGPRTEQYKQVGNAVPPLLAKQIAEVVAQIMKDA